MMIQSMVWRLDETKPRASGLKATARRSTDLYRSDERRLFAGKPECGSSSGLKGDHPAHLSAG